MTDHDPTTRLAPASALRLRDVTFAYPQREPILRGVDLDVRAGEITVVLGPNGCGKSTLLRVAAGLVRPRSGSAQLADGESASAASRGGRIGYIPQQLGLVRNATALDNAVIGGIAQMSSIGAFLGVVPASVRDRALAALDTVGLREKAHLPAKHLSGGERQRVAIARTLVQQARVIVADELLSSLDVMQAEAVLQVQDALRKQGVAVLMSLHQLDVALTHADKVVFLARGRLTDAREPSGITLEEARCALTP